ncbi:hypothetical protein F5877DRAFT_83391 [Lentinula edodes]|nr:hypothetical protein F5877DRAFT_83391 [Lentinula edodes]
MSYSRNENVSLKPLLKVPLSRRSEPSTNIYHTPNITLEAHARFNFKRLSTALARLYSNTLQPRESPHPGHGSDISISAKPASSSSPTIPSMSVSSLPLDSISPSSASCSNHVTDSKFCQDSSVPQDDGKPLATDAKAVEEIPLEPTRGQTSGVNWEVYVVRDGRKFDWGLVESGGNGNNGQTAWSNNEGFLSSPLTTSSSSTALSLL